MFQLFNIGVKGVIVKDNKVLLLKRKSTYQNAYFWDMAGGRMNKKDSIENTLAREVKEELGVKIKTTKQLIKVAVDKQYVKAVKNTYLLLLYFLIEVTNYNFKLSKEHEEMVWVNKNDIKNLPKNIFLPKHTKEIILQLT